MAKVYHHEIYGLRETKYDWLNKHHIKNVKWNKLEPQSEFYLFIPQDQKMFKIYKTFKNITDIFPVNSVGIVTARDALTIGWNEDEIWNRVQNFARLEIELARQTYQLGEDTRDWKVEFAQKDLKESGIDKNHLTPILYRPFDVRYTYYTGKSRGFHCRPRSDVMRHMLEPNNSLCFMRQVSTSGSYTQVLISEHMVDNRTFFSSKGIIQQAPLYLYPETDKKDLFSEHETGEKKPNIKLELFEELKKNYKKEVTPEEIFYYIYAILYSNTYRTKYSEFLKIDFPRVPFTKNHKLFIQLGKLGKQLADLHLLKSKELDKPISKFPINGSNKVEKPFFTVETRHGMSSNVGRVQINTTQYFDGISPEIWNYQIGGYQVCEKWLKDRKGRTLTLEEIQTYCKIVTALSKTIELQKEIDKHYQDVE
ncbi:MAG: helicase [Bacteroidetes bacterium]|nr:helicase [Bacteroidota bacterium]